MNDTHQAVHYLDLYERGYLVYLPISVAYSSLFLPILELGDVLCGLPTILGRPPPIVAMGGPDIIDVRWQLWT